MVAEDASRAAQSDQSEQVCRTVGDFVSVQRPFTNLRMDLQYHSQVEENVMLHNFRRLGTNGQIAVAGLFFLTLLMGLLAFYVL